MSTIPDTAQNIIKLGYEINRTLIAAALVSLLITKDPTFIMSVAFGVGSYAAAWLLETLRLHEKPFKPVFVFAPAVFTFVSFIALLHPHL